MNYMRQTQNIALVTEQGPFVSGAPSACKKTCRFQAVGLSSGFLIFPPLINTTHMLGKTAFRSWPKRVKHELCLERDYKISIRLHQNEPQPHQIHNSASSLMRVNATETS